MKIGDVVKWSSQAGGYMKSKQGIIVEVVPALQSPKMKMSGVSGLSRRHESYVVHVGSALGMKNFYWPVVSGLTVLVAATKSEAEATANRHPVPTQGESVPDSPERGPKLFFIPHIGREEATVVKPLSPTEISGVASGHMQHLRDGGAE